MMKKILLALTSLGLAAVSSQALAAIDHGVYVGALLGRSSMDYTVSNQNFQPGSRDEYKGFAWDANVGYLLNRNFAIQGDFLDFHNASFDNIHGVSGADVTYKQKAADVVGKLIFPFGNGFNIYATGGVAYVDLTRDANSTAKAAGYSLSDKQKVKATYGVGAGYDFYPNWGVNLAWSQIPSGGSIEKSNFLGAGLSYYFT